MDKEFFRLQVRIARFHNIFGPEGTWRAGREKAPAAIWGDGKHTRSFLYIDECVDGVRRLVDSGFTGPGERRLRRDGHRQPIR
jgi:nucleoside-diphosphate-sugar epimerase